MYHILHILLFSALIQAKVQIFVTDTPIVQIGSRVYKKELVTSQYSSPKELAYDPFSRNLYFMYMDPMVQNSRRAFINIDTKLTKKIDGIKFNKATAVDRTSGDVYFGSENGLYKYDPENNRAVNIGLYDTNILKLIAREGELYFIDANNHMLYKVLWGGGGAVKMGNWKTVMQFDVDYERNYHFVTMYGVFCAKDGHETVKIDLDAAHHYVIEKEFTLAVNVNTLYKIECSNGTAEKIVDLNFIPSSFIFGDNGDIIYTVEDEIYRLTPIDYYYVFNIRRKSKNIDNNSIL